MIVYHGSNHNFKNLRISKNLVEHRSTLENEGLGIYFSTNRAVAESYGKYVYTLEISDNALIDFRKKQTCREYLRKIRSDIYHNLGVDIYSYIDFEVLITNMHCGGVCLHKTGREIYMCLDSNYKWYEELTEKKRQNVYKLLRKADKSLLNKAYLFTYHIKDIGVAKTVDPSVIRIIKKEFAIA